jgi:hypothetical protein
MMGRGNRRLEDRPACEQSQSNLFLLLEIDAEGRGGLLLIGCFCFLLLITPYFVHWQAIALASSIALKLKCNSGGRCQQ